MSNTPRILPPSARSRGIPPYPQDPRYHQQPVSPIHMSGSIVLQPGASGSIPTSSLLNPIGMDMEILEIKFEISGTGNSTDPSVPTVQVSPCFGGTIACELLLGTIKLTNGAIPVWLFGRLENPGAQSDVQDIVSGTSYAYHSWRLPRPLFIPAGTTITPNFTHTGLVPDALNVRIAYSGRSVSKQPKKIHVPWVASYVSKVFIPVSTSGLDRSSDTDLINPSDDPLHLQRLTAHTINIFQAAGSQILEDGFPQFVASQAMKIRITDSFGRPIVRSFTTIQSVFSSATQSWEMDNGAIVDPHSFYIVDTRLTGSAASIAAGLSTQMHIGMVGWHEEEAS